MEPSLGRLIVGILLWSNSSPSSCLFGAMTMDSDKPLSVRVPKFKGTPERWPAWRDTMEAIMGAYKLINAINNPRPVDAPVVVNQAEGGGGEELS